MASGRENGGLSVAIPGISGRPSMLNGDTRRRIVENIRQGAYGWVAAASCGIPRGTFHRWLAEGRKAVEALERGDADLTPIQLECVIFLEEITIAEAEARIAAEQAVLAADPFKWLRYGPGREKPGQPGWSDQVAHTGDDGGPIQVDVVRDRLSSELERIESARARIASGPVIEANVTELPPDHPAALGPPLAFSKLADESEAPDLTVPSELTNADR